jgi:hypothetical protein
MPDDPETGGWVPGPLSKPAIGKDTPPPTPAKPKTEQFDPKTFGRTQAPPASDDDPDVPGWVTHDPIGNLFFSGPLRGIARQAAGVGGLASDLGDLAARSVGAPQVAGQIAKSGPAQAFKQWANKPGADPIESAGIGLGELAAWGPFSPERILGGGVKMDRMLDSMLTPRLFKQFKAAREAVRRSGLEDANPSDLKILNEIGEAFKARYVQPRTSGLGKVAQSALGGAVIGGAQQAGSWEERGANAAWGAALGGALRGLGVAAPKLGSVAEIPKVKSKLSAAIDVAVGEALGTLVGAPHLTGSAAAFALRGAGRRALIGDLIADRLPQILQFISKTTGPRHTSVLGTTAPFDVEEPVDPNAAVQTDLARAGAPQTFSPETYGRRR